MINRGVEKHTKITTLSGSTWKPLMWTAKQKSLNFQCEQVKASDEGML